MDQNLDSSDEDNNFVWQYRAEMALASVIAADKLITYAELAEAAIVPPPHRIHKLALWLEKTLLSDHHAGHTLRMARVISRSRDGLPAPGFFIKCRELGLYDGPDDGPLAKAFHMSLLS